MKAIFVIVVLYFEAFKAQRRITNGHLVSGEKKYMVYLLQDPLIKNITSSWTCGGVIVSQYHVLTSAACLVTVPRCYIVAGYKTYVNAWKMSKDRCIVRTARKIVKYCYPKSFNRATIYKNASSWNFGDIAIASVKFPFDFGNKDYGLYCSYYPAPIKVGYNVQFHRCGIDVITLGWGHERYYRPDGSNMDLNSKFLRYSSGTITCLKDCINAHGLAFKRAGDFTKHFSMFSICVDEAGNLDENGQIIYTSPVVYNGCDDFYDPTLVFEKDNYSSSLRHKDDNRNSTFARVGGFCQNDHGGPLVTWIGGQEIVIGVASFFAVTKEMQCRNPYIYTSTASINKLLKCFLDDSSGAGRSPYCEDEVEEFDFLQQEVDWPEGLE